MIVLNLSAASAEEMGNGSSTRSSSRVIPAPKRSPEIALGKYRKQEFYMSNMENSLGLMTISIHVLVASGEIE